MQMCMGWVWSRCTHLLCILLTILAPLLRSESVSRSCMGKESCFSVVHRYCHTIQCSPLCLFSSYPPSVPSPLSLSLSLLYSTDQMQLNPRVHASFKSLANEMRVVHSLDTPTRSSARRARGREANAASCLVLILLKALNAA